MNGSDVFCCHFVHRHARKVEKTYSESSFPDGSNDTIFRSLGLSEAEQSSFKVKTNDPSGFCQFLATKRSMQIFSSSSDDDFSAQNRPRDLKMVSLEPSGNKDSEYVDKIVLACLWTKRQCKTSGDTLFHSLVGGGGTVGQIGPQRKWKWQHFVNLMKMIDFSLPSVTHI